MDEEEETLAGSYDNGHWWWNDQQNCIEWASNAPNVQEDQALAPAATIKPQGGIAHFRDDIDVLEQIRFRRRYQRKLNAGEPDIIKLQDIKDLAIYTAPLHILSPMLIELLHQLTTERFIRALILYCQYYLQVLEEMTNRRIEGTYKIRTDTSDAIEAVFAQNLADLRAVVAKEYSVMLIGGDDTVKFHHMGPNKKIKSLTNRDVRLSETMLQMCTQIVWLALERKSFNQLELEVHRLFKTEVFNIIEHNLKTGYMEDMSPYERNVLMGPCLRRDKKIQAHSPLLNEVFCCKDIDFKMMGIGVISYPELSERLEYMAKAISAPEETFRKAKITLGILGMDRSRFDIMLRPLPPEPEMSSKEKSLNSQLAFRRVSSMKKSTINLMPDKVYAEISLPDAGEPLPLPPVFPCKDLHMIPCGMEQKHRWHQRLKKLLLKGKPRT